MEICEICGNSDEAHTELCPRKDQSTIEQLIAERDKARSQLAALQAEAARVVGDLMICFDEPADTDSAVAMEREIRRINSARAFLASLPRPTVVAVPIEPRATPIEINEAAVKVANNVYWSVDENDDVRMRAAIVAYREGGDVMGERQLFTYAVALGCFAILTIGGAWAYRMSQSSTSAPVTVSIPSAPNESVETPYCGRAGWALDSFGQCVAIDPEPIPRPRFGTCPGAFEIWRYDQAKPAICVRRI